MAKSNGQSNGNGKSNGNGGSEHTEKVRFLDLKMVSGIAGIKWDGKSTWTITARIDQEKDPKAPPTIDLPYTDPPHDTLMESLQALASHAFRIIGIKKGKGVVEVRELVLTSYTGEDYNFQIKGIVRPPEGPGSTSWNAPVRSTSEGPTKAPEPTTFTAIDRLQTLCMNYVRGDRPQLTLDFEATDH